MPQNSGPGMLLCKRCSIVSRARSRARQDLRYLLVWFAVFLAIPLSAGIAGYFARPSPPGSSERMDFSLKQEMAEVKDAVREMRAQLAKQGKASELPPVQPAATAEAKAPDELPYLYLEKLVASISQAAIGPIARKLEGGDTQAKLDAILEIARTREQAAVPLLERSLKDDDPLVRSLSAKALASLGSQGSVGKLMTALGDPEIFVRNSVAGALSNLTGDTFLYYEDIPPEKWEKLQKFKERQK